MDSESLLIVFLNDDSSSMNYKGPFEFLKSSDSNQPALEFVEGSSDELHPQTFCGTILRSMLQPIKNIYGHVVSNGFYYPSSSL